MEFRRVAAVGGGADFRLAVQAPSLKVRRVTVTRLGVPAEAGQTRRGWQEDFSRPLGAEWARVGVGDGENLFEAADGLLRVRPTSGDRGWLALLKPESRLDAGEILARLRAVGPSSDSGLWGGLAMGIDPARGAALTCELEAGSGTETAIGLRDDRLVGPPRAAFPWRPNVWYWLRVRHEALTLVAYPEIRARVWAADGETPEPDAWLTWWDYYPAAPLRRGWAGWRAGAVGTGIECDYFLLKTDALDEIEVRLPALKPDRPRLEPLAWSAQTGVTLALHGSPDSAYVMALSPDLTHWQEQTLPTDASGKSMFHDPTATNRPRSFYRALVPR